ncbi:MAG: hypothetical protein ACFFDN_19640 [Candidatus Hodarchaeota archaeon]
MAKFLIEMTPQELNSYLIEKYDLGLHPFALFFCQMLGAGDIISGFSFAVAPNREIALDLREKLQNLKKKIIFVLADCEHYLLENSYFKNIYKKSKKEAEISIIKEYGLESFFNMINRIIDCLDLDLKFRHPGAPIKKKHYIASSWAHLIQDSKYKIEWNIVADLLDWFWEMLRPYEIYHEFNPEGKESDPEYLRNQFYRNKSRSFNYFKEMKRRKFKKSWLDIQTAVFMGEKSMFLLDYSELADEDFYLDLKEDIPILKSIIAKEIDLREVHKDWIRKAYEYYALKLYTENSIPPKVIFPDLSYI